MHEDHVLVPIPADLWRRHEAAWAHSAKVDPACADDDPVSAALLSIECGCEAMEGVPKLGAERAGWWAKACSSY